MVVTREITTRPPIQIMQQHSILRIVNYVIHRVPGSLLLSTMTLSISRFTAGNTRVNGIPVQIVTQIQATILYSTVWAATNKLKLIQTTGMFQGIPITARPAMDAILMEPAGGKLIGSNKYRLMKYILSLFLFLYLMSALSAQDVKDFKEGSVSFISSQNVYIKFASTENISIGDTLFSKEGSELVPAMVVTNLSSISCVCTSLISKEWKVGEQVVSKQRVKAPSQPVNEQVVADNAAAT